MKHNFLYIPVTLPKWPHEMFLSPFHIYQCANCKEYRLEIDHSDTFYEAKDGKLVPDTGCTGGPLM